MLVSVFAANAVVKRGLASTVLLSRTWETQTVAQLRQESKSRGLSSSGNKASLIQRLKEFETRTTQEAPAAPAGARAASTTAAAVDPNVFNIKLPDLYQPVPELPVQVPYVPDFWDSANQPIEPRPEGSIPKLLVVAGATTHHGGGPSHNALPDAPEDISPAPAPSPVQKHAAPSGPGGLFFDMAEDLGLLSAVPAAKPARRPFWQLFG